MARQPLRPADWKHWVGTALMAAAIVLLASAIISPPGDDEPTAYLVGYYVGGVTFLGLGWWLRSRSDID